MRTRGALISALVVALLFAGASYLTNIYEDQLYALVAMQGMWGMSAYVFLAVVSTVLAPFSTLPLIPVASHMWGWVTAGLLSIAGWVIGSQIAYMLARTWGRSLVQRIVAVEHFDYFEQYFAKERLFWSVVFLRMSVPVDILSYAIGLFSQMGPGAFFLSTLIGVAPFAFVFAYVGTLSLSLQLFVFIEVMALVLTLHFIQKKSDMRRAFLLIAVGTISFVGYVYRVPVIEFVQSLAQLSMDRPVLAGLILIALKTVSAPLGFPGTPLTLLSGSLFGIWVGTAVALVGNTLGATLAFLLSRFALKDYVEKSLFTKYQTLHSFEERLASRPFATVFFLRLIPLFPFNALNFLLGVTHIPLRAYVLGSFIGMIPGTFMFVYFGDSLRALSPLNIAVSSAGIIALILIGKYYAKH